MYIRVVTGSSSKSKCTAIDSDDIDFVYPYEAQSLMCIVHFLKVPIVLADVETSHIAEAYVTSAAVAA